LSDRIDVRISKGRPGYLEIVRAGIPVSPVIQGFTVWTNGKLLEIPVRKLRPRGNGWVAAGGLRTKEGTWVVEDRLAPRGNTLVVDRRWSWRGGRLSSVRLGLDLLVPFRRLDFWAMPYISMNGNRGSKTVPTGMSRDGKPWVFREERTTAPGLMTLESGGAVAGSYTEAGSSESTISACCILPGNGGHTLRTFFPFYEAPYTFLGAAYPGNSNVPAQGLYTCGSGGANGLVVDSGARFRRKFFVVLDRAAECRHGHVRVWESAWRNLCDPLPPSVPIAKTERTLWRSLDPWWISKGKVRGFGGRLDRDGDPYGGFTPIIGVGWCSPVMMLAYLALRRAIRAGRPQLAERAIQAAEFFIENAGLGNGLFRTHFHLKTMRWMDSGLDAVQMGGASYWLLRCTEILGRTKMFRQRVDPKAWGTFALRFCDTAVRTQLSDGAFASRWSPGGKRLGTERAMGVHAARAVLEAWRHTGDHRYLEAAERGAKFYIREVIDRESGYGDCTDILDSTTENDAAGVPDFLIDLYRDTGRKLYLDKAVRAAEYCLAYMYAYNVHFPRETDCGRRGMRTRGSSAISPETAFISFFFAPQANAFLELWKETGERRWKDYAVAVIRGTVQMLTEPGDTFGLAPHLIGCRAEVLPVLDTVKGEYIWKKGMTGYSWHQPIYWPAVFNLLNFAFFEDRFPDVRREIERP
jgi:hypothetical protein